VRINFNGSYTGYEYKREHDIHKPLNHLEGEKLKNFINIPAFASKMAKFYSFCYFLYAEYMLFCAKVG